MTPKQEERIRTKIATIRKILAAEKRKFGGYDDSRGLRYMPPELFLKLHDYKGGLTYLRWFQKNFPDDIGFPDFLFEWTIILFKTGKMKDAEQKAIQTYFSNIYVFDKFFGRDIVPVDTYEGSYRDNPMFLEHFSYSAGHSELKDFSEWLIQFEQTDYFQDIKFKYIDIQKRLNTETDLEKRRYLIRQSDQLLEKESK